MLGKVLCWGGAIFVVLVIYVFVAKWVCRLIGIEDKGDDHIDAGSGPTGPVVTV